MKNASYKAYGCDEYANYMSNDNGKTWEIININAKEVQKAVDAPEFSRIIYGSLSNGGLTYSDDNGLTIHFSDHPTGNWDSINWTSDKVFAHSLDDGRIVYTLDWGETWIDFLPGSGSGSGELEIDGDGNLKIVDNDGTKIINTSLVGTDEENKAIVGIYPNSDLDGNGELSSNDFNDYDYNGYDTEIDSYGNKRFKVSGVLLILINKYLLPQIVYNLTGYTDPKALGFNDGFTWESVSYNKFFSDGQIYNITRNNSIIDLEADVGMKPISVNIYKDTSELNDISLTESIKDVGDGRLKDTLETIDLVLDLHRDYARQRISDIIGETPADTSEIYKLNTDSEDYANAISMLQLYLNVQKGSVISIVGTMIGYIFNFDTQKKIALLKAAIYETIIKKIGALNFQLNQIKEKLDSNLEIDASEIDLSYNFSEGLDEAIKKYISSATKSIKYLSQGGQKGLVNIAADQYKAEYRPIVLEDLATKFIGAKVGDRITSLDTVVDAEDAWRELNVNSRGTLNDEQIENLVAELEVDINETNLKIFFNNIYKDLFDKMNALLANYNVEDYWWDDYEISDLADSDIVEIKHYYKQITGDEYLASGSGFKGRCVELLREVLNSYVENSGGYEVLAEQLKEEVQERNRQWLKNTNYNKDTEDSLKNYQKNIFQELKNGWYKNRRMI